VTDLAPVAAEDMANPRGAFLRMVKDHLAPTISDPDLQYFGLAAQRTGLSPFTDPAQIVAVPRYNKQARRTVHRPLVTIDGRTALAMRSGRITAIGEGEWCGPSDSKNGVPPVWVGFWDDDAPPHGARATVWTVGTDVPTRAVVRWEEFAQRDTHGSLIGLWERMPAHMLHKTALALCLRRAVPDILPKDLVLYSEADAETTVTVEEVGAVPPPPEVGKPYPERSRPDHPAEIAGAASPDRPGMPLGQAPRRPGVNVQPEAVSSPVNTPGAPTSGRHRFDDDPPDSYYDDLPEARGRR
jgi:hypothetical protein